ncbi:MAG: NADH-quinone oxidoreductase subunit M [Gammaproteobacteria bacterium]|nr:NADH-quinone oxidoreductase subunit M [Gammaproteobacteria bacterium]
MLSLLIWLPILCGVSALIWQRHARLIALSSSLVSIILGAIVWINFLPSSSTMQFQTFLPWIKALDINYALGIDGISLLLILLTIFIGFLITIYSLRKEASFLASFLFLQGTLIGAFCALDAILFYAFSEAMLIPIFMLIGIWGGKDRVYAAFKFFIYTFAGSILLLIAILYLHTYAHSFMINRFYNLPLTHTQQLLVFLALATAFAIKLPVWPLHTWLPDAHTQAPTAGSVILAAIFLKVGGYGFLRFVLPITPHICQQAAPLLLIITVLAIIYIGVIAIVQKHFKQLIAYSSIAHMGFVVLGCFLLTRTSLTGSVMQLVTHGLVIAALFFIAGILYKRTKTYKLNAFGGLATAMPKLATLTLFFVLAAIAFPGTGSFVSKFLILMAAFKYNLWLAIGAALALVLSSAYMLLAYKQIFFGKAKTTAIITDLTASESAILVSLAAAILIIGLFPNLFIRDIAPSIQHLIIASGI